MSEPTQERTAREKNDPIIKIHGAIEAHPPESLVKQHNAERKEDSATHIAERQEDRGRETTKLLIEGATLAAVIIYAFITYLQWYQMRKTLLIDERAWVSIPFSAGFPLTGAYIPVTSQIVNSGKTPARQAVADVIATVLDEGEKPALGKFSAGYAYNRIYSGAIFTNAPIPLTIPVVHYGPQGEQGIVPDEALRDDIANGRRFIVFFGRIDYYDVFGIHHWTQFCTGSGPAINESVKECIQYNDVDTNEK